MSKISKHQSVGQVNIFFLSNSNLGESLMDGLTRPQYFAHADTIANTMWGSSWPPAKDWSRWEGSLEMSGGGQIGWETQKGDGSLLVCKQLWILCVYKHILYIQYESIWINMISLAPFGQCCAPAIFPQDRCVAGFPKALDKGLARGLPRRREIWCVKKRYTRVCGNEGAWGIIKIDSW